MATTPAVADNRQKPLTYAVYAVLSLLVTTGVYVSLSLRYNHHLVQTGQFSWLRATNEYSVLADSLFYAFQLLVALAFFRPLKHVFAHGREGSSAMGGTPKEMGWGVLGGALALTIGVPSLLGRGGPQDALGAFLVNHFYSPSGVLLLVISIFLLPILSEGFFRGVLLRRLLQSTSWPAAVLVTALLFTFFWPTFSLIPGLALGLVAGIVFYRTESLVSCIVANCVFTIGAVILLMWRAA